MSGIYLYCVTADVPRLRSAAPDVRGVPDGRTACRVIETAGLSVLVSEYDGPAVQDLGKGDLLRYLLVHQQVLEQILPHVAIIPVKFGTVLTSDDEVRAVVERYQETLRRALDEVGNAVEINLSASWDEQAVLADVRQEAAIQAEARLVQSEVAAQVRLGRSVQEALERRREQLRRQVVTELVPLAVDAQSNPRPTEDMVANLAFLVSRDDLHALEARVDRLGAELGDRLTFRYIGPLPPYSFATVVVARADAARLESARQLLGVSEGAGEEEIVVRYRELAAASHPDRNPGVPAASERFAALTAARNELIRYVGTAGGEGSDAETLPSQGGSAPGAASVALEVVRADSYAGIETEVGNAAGSAN